MELMDYDITVLHRSGAKMHVPDMLSRLGFDGTVRKTVAQMAENGEYNTINAVLGKQASANERLKWRLAAAGNDKGEDGFTVHEQVKSEAVEQKILDGKHELHSRAAEVYDLICPLTRAQKQSINQTAQQQEEPVSEEGDEANSTRNEVAKPNIIQGEVVKDDVRDEVADLQRQDVGYKMLIEYLQNGTLPEERLDRIRVVEQEGLRENWEARMETLVDERRRKTDERKPKKN